MAKPIPRIIYYLIKELKKFEIYYLDSKHHLSTEEIYDIPPFNQYSNFVTNLLTPNKSSKLNAVIIETKVYSTKNKEFYDVQ